MSLLYIQPFYGAVAIVSARSSNIKLYKIVKSKTGKEIKLPYNIFAGKLNTVDHKDKIKEINRKFSRYLKQRNLSGSIISVVSNNWSWNKKTVL
jgi:hypothetical protein